MCLENFYSVFTIWVVEANVQVVFLAIKVTGESKKIF